MDYRQLLQTELIERIKRNSSYSIRAMARDVALSPAFLSQILKGRRELSEAKAAELAKRLAWTQQQTTIFLQLVRLAKAKTPQLKREILSQFKEEDTEEAVIRHFSLSAKRFSVVSDWYHFAIVELTAIKGFRSDHMWIARKLGITPIEAEHAIDRLLDLGLLSRKDGALVREKNCSIGDVPSEAIRKFHLQNIKNAARALKDQPFDQRHISGVTMAIDSRKYARAIKRINRFRQEMIKSFGSGEELDQVYQLNIQIFRLTQEEKA